MRPPGAGAILRRDRNDAAVFGWMEIDLVDGNRSDTEVREVHTAFHEQPGRRAGVYRFAHIALIA
jgi:hypothetical protein